MDNGKVDRNALPDLERLLSNQDYVAPITEVEKLLVKLWADVLNINIDILGIRWNFYVSMLVLILLHIFIHCVIILNDVNLGFDDIFLQFLSVICVIPLRV